MKKLSESVWGDIRQKSLGKEDRKENTIGNIKHLKPLDMGGSVLWADNDFIYDGNQHFYFQEAINLVKGTGWRLPTLQEVAELDSLPVHQDNVSHYLTYNGERLTFLKLGIHHNAAGWLDRDRYYYGWTSDMYDNKNVHIITFYDNKLWHSPIDGNRSSMNQVIQDKFDQCCIRLVKDK